MKDKASTKITRVIVGVICLWPAIVVASFTLFIIAQVLELMFIPLLAPLGIMASFNLLPLHFVILLLAVILSMIHVVKNPGLQRYSKSAWMVTILLLSVIAVPLYYLTNMRSRPVAFEGKANRKWLVAVCAFIVVTIFLSPFAMRLFAGWIFINERFEVEIPQDIGGKLVCQGSYGCDQHDCESMVDYTYVNSKGMTTKIGFGWYHGQNWDRNVQIQKIQNHLLLKAEHYPEAVMFIGELNGAKWIKYDFTLDKINSNPVWKATGIDSLPQYSLYSSTEITEIMGDGEIDVIYKFVINNNRDTDKRLLVYKLDSGGVPQLTEIKDI